MKDRKLVGASALAIAVVAGLGAAPAGAVSSNVRTMAGIDIYGLDRVDGKWVTARTYACKRGGWSDKSVKVTIKTPNGSISRSSLLGDCKVRAKLWAKDPFHAKTTHEVTTWSGAKYSYSD